VLAATEQSADDTRSQRGGAAAVTRGARCFGRGQTGGAGAGRGRGGAGAGRGGRGRGAARVPAGTRGSGGRRRRAGATQMLTYVCWFCL